MTKLSPFRYLKTSPEIIRLAVMLYFRFPHPKAGSAAVTHFAKSAILGDSESLTEPILPRAPDTASYPPQNIRLKWSYQLGLAHLAVPQPSLGVTWPNLNGSGSKALGPGSPIIAPPLIPEPFLQTHSVIFCKAHNNLAI